MIDTGCDRASSGGYGQYQAYSRQKVQPESIDKTRMVHCKFGIGAATSNGMEKVCLPVQNVLLSLSVHIVDGDVPLMISLEDMDRMKLVYINLQDRLQHV